MENLRGDLPKTTWLAERRAGCRAGGGVASASPPGRYCFEDSVQSAQAL